MGLEGVGRLFPPLTAGAIDEHGYLQSRDGLMRVIFIQPRSRSDEIMCSATTST